MEDFGDYIYLILIVIAGLSGLLKKKKEKPTPIPVEEEYQPVEEEVWEDFLPEKPVARVPEPQTGFFDWENKAIKIATYENTEDPSKLRVKNIVDRYKSTIQQTPKKIQVVEAILPEINIELSTIEDARMAFIYTEIFNKKY